MQNLWWVRNYCYLCYETYLSATSVTDGFPELLAGLSNAVENNSIEVTSILDLILIQVQNLNNSESEYKKANSLLIILIYVFLSVDGCQNINLPA